MSKFIYINKKELVENIKVPEDFASTTPAQWKVDTAIDYYKEHGEFDRAIVVKEDGTIEDGYARFVAAKELGLTEIDVVVRTKAKANQKALICYVYGVHPEEKNPKERVWRVPKMKKYKGWTDDVLPGDTIFVKTVRGAAPVIVSKIEWTRERPRDERIRCVCTWDEMQNLTV